MKKEPKKESFEDAVDDVLESAREFFKMEAAGGIMLVMAAVLALIIANTGLYDLYTFFLSDLHFKVGLSDQETAFKLVIDKPILLWINDGLMALFFFLIGLEIKREIVEGELSSRERVILPLIAAIGGVAAPAAIFWFINQNTPEYMPGWAIPAATDIAFALGVLALLGTRAPIALKILLTAVAVIDDLAAIIIIALFYTESIQINALYIAAVCLVGLFVLNQRKVFRLTPYVLLGFIMWAAVLKSGVHATLAGVVTALFIPLRCESNPEFSPCKHLEHSLHPWVAFLILPVFGFANAGISFEGMSFDDLLNPLTLGIAGGLFLGKQIGIFTAIVATIKLGLSPMPERTTWLQLYGVSLLCGIGFTMSLFVGGLAFDTQDNAAYVRLGVLSASFVSAIIGYLVIRYGGPKPDALAKGDK